VSPQEAAIRASAKAFETSFNAKNAKAIAAQFTENGEMVEIDGSLTSGRQAIEGVFAESFETYPQGKIEVIVDEVRFPSPSIAIEEGFSKTTGGAREDAHPGRYEAIHQQQPDGKWLLASVRSLANTDASLDSTLDELDWLVGEWVDESNTVTVATTYRWAEGHNYLLANFKVQRSGESMMQGDQRIGWDPALKKIKSWVFHADGGFAEGTWTRQDDRWIVRSSGTARDGQPFQATSILTRIGPHVATWQVVDRTMGSEILPDADEVRIVKVPPKPGAAAAAAKK
jgi:uncharacterized protein (TIGR02246 family)